MSFYSCCLLLCFCVYLWLGKGSRLLGWISVTLIVTSWSSEISCKADSGNKGRNGITSKMFQLLASPRNRNITFQNSKKSLHCTMLCNCIQLSHVTCSFRTKKSDVWSECWWRGRLEMFSPPSLLCIHCIRYTPVPACAGPVPSCVRLSATPWTMAR